MNTLLFYLFLLCFWGEKALGFQLSSIKGLSFMNFSIYLLLFAWALKVAFKRKFYESSNLNKYLLLFILAGMVSIMVKIWNGEIQNMSMLGEIAPGCKSTVGLSNVSNGTPAHLRPYLNRTYLIMLMKYGLYSAIVDAFDSETIKIARGEKPEIVNLVHRVMDGERPDLSSLSEEEVKYVKTVRVLTGESLYSHSWLEI